MTLSNIKYKQAPIIITTIGKETIDAINAGHNTNQRLAEALDGVTDNMGSRVSRLRKQGLVVAYRKPDDLPKCNQPLYYRVLDVPYTVDAHIKHAPKKTTPKTYAGMGEEVFNNLDFYLYPKST